MKTYHSRRILTPLSISLFLCLATAAAFGDDWPITFAKLKVPASAYGGVERKAPAFDCQPESFEPQKTQYQPASGVSATSAAYKVEGTDNAVLMTIDSRSKQDDVKTVLPEPYTLTKYIFTCASGSSEVFEFKKNGKNYALYTHVSQARFSPDLKKVVLYNYAKPHHGPWQELRRIIDIGSRRFTPLPVINETAFLADVNNGRIVTYGMSAGAKGQRRIAAVWSYEGKLIQALSTPSSGESSGDAFGLLPDEPSTFYHLARTGDGTCTHRLQDIQRPEGQRAIQLKVPGAVTDPAAVGTRVQIDLAGLKLKGGAMKYRVSPSGKGDAAGDWGAWQTAQ